MAFLKHRFQGLVIPWLLAILTIIPMCFGRLNPIASNGADYDAVFPGVKRLVSRASENDPFGDVKYHSGYIEVGPYGGEMFYLYFPKANSTSDTPFFLWLTGGPGCSSSLAALTENGPFMLEQDGKLYTNEFGWSNLGDIVYIDQPLGTGFSIANDSADYATNETMVANDIREFIEKFLRKFKYLQNRPFYFTGESYAGHYIPSVADTLLSQPIEFLNFKGIAMGNAWVDPETQYEYYANFAYKNEMINRDQYEMARGEYKFCVQLIQKGLWPLALVACNSLTSSLVGDRNPYDIRLDCVTPPLCYSSEPLNSFMNSNSVQNALGVKKKWRECNALVYSLLLGDWVTETRTKVSRLVQNGKKVLIYNGKKDFICNYMGGRAWVKRIEWPKQEEFNYLLTGMGEFKIDGKVVGDVTSLDNLAFVTIEDAGHMVPMDQPRIAFEMLKRYLLGIPEEKKPRFYVELKEKNPIVVLG